MKKLLVATDLSERSAPAVQRAAQLMHKQGGGEWTWLHVVDDDAPEDFVTAHVQRAEALLQEQAQQVAEQAGSRPRVLVLRGQVEQVITEIAEQLQPDLILVGQHRPGRLLDLFRGTTVARLIRACHVPVLRVANEVRGDYAHTLLALDLSPASLQALQRARELDLLDLEHCDAVYAITPIPVSVVAEVGNNRRLLQAQAREAREQLLRGLEGVGVSFPEARLHLPLGEPGHALELVRKETAADLLVMGTHARQGIQRFLLGSIASRMLADSHGDVLVVPPHA